jgi:hypothetical protein
MGWNPFSPEVNEGQSLGYNARAPVRFGATGGLTEEEFDIFVRGYLIDSAYPGTPDQDKVSKKRVASTDQESFVEVPITGYTIPKFYPNATHYYTTLTYQGFVDSIFKDNDIGTFRGLSGGRVHGADSTAADIDQSTAAKIRIVELAEELGATPNVADYLEELYPEGVMWFQKKARSVHPGVLMPLFSPAMADPYGRDLSKSKVEEIVSSEFQLRHRFDCMIIRVYPMDFHGQLGYLKNHKAAFKAKTGIDPDVDFRLQLGRNKGVFVAYTVFNDADYIKYRAKLVQLTKQAQERFVEKVKGQPAGYVLDNSTGKWREAKLLKKQVEALKAKVKPKVLYPEKKPDYQALLKLRLENAQALLILGMKDIMNLNGAIPVLKTVKDTAARGKGVIPASAIPPGTGRMSTECLNLFTGEPQSLVDLLANPYSIEAMLCAHPDELSYLQPSLQFFMDYNNGKPAIPVNFPDHTNGDKILDLAKARVSNAESIKRIFQERGVSGTNVGIKSFQWGFQNKHKGDTTLKARLTLYFGDTAELLNEEYLRFVFGGSVPQARSLSNNSDVEAKKLLAAVTERIKTLKDPKTDFYASNNPYSSDLEESKALGTRSIDPPPQLKVRAGWSVPQDAGGNLSTKFKEGVEQSQRYITLRMWQYEVNFGEQGQVELTLDYTGGIDEFLGTPDKSNIFDTAIDPTELHARREWVATGTKLTADGADGDELIEVSIAGRPNLLLEAWKDGYISRQGKGRSGSNVGDGTNVKTFPDGVKRVALTKAGVLYELRTLRLWKKAIIKLGGKKPSPRNSENLRKISKWMSVCRSALSEIDRNQADMIYSSFIDKLIAEGKLYFATTQRGLVEGRFKNDQSVQFSSTSQYGNRVTLGTVFGQTATHKQGWFLDVRGKGAKASEAGVAAISERFKKVIDYQSGAASAGNFANEAKNYLDPVRTQAECLEPGVDKENTILYYMKLGDILDIIMCGLRKKSDSPNIEYIMGTFHPALLGIPGHTDSDVYSLRDIPISLDYFGHWFIKNFVSKQNKPRASFRRFTQSLLTELVGPLFNRVLRDTSSNNLGRMEFGFTSIASPVNVAGSQNTFRLIDADKIKTIASNKGKQNSDRSTQTEYFLMYLKQLNPKLIGDRQADHDRGIYHLTLGADRGLVKSFSFSQIDLPYYKEMILEQGSYAEGIFLPQNVQITMIGNTYFVNGQTIFVNADFGLGTAARKLGIGGYYTIYQVENYIASGQFETRLSCQFVKRLGG